MAKIFKNKVLKTHISGQRDGYISEKMYVLGAVASAC